MIRNAYIVLLLGSTPSKAVLEGLLELLTEINRAWYIEQWQLRRDPPESARDAGVIWQPDQLDVRAIFQDAPTVFAMRMASCGPIAAIAAGHARARDQLDGYSIAAARGRHRVVLRPQGRGAWHAYVEHAQFADGSSLEDPTRGMLQ